MIVMGTEEKDSLLTIGMFPHELEISYPNELERKSMLKSAFTLYTLEVDITSYSKQIAGFSWDDITTLAQLSSR